MKDTQEIIEALFKNLFKYGELTIPLCAKKCSKEKRGQCGI